MSPESGLGLLGSGLDSAFSRYLEEGDTHDFMIRYTPAHTDWPYFSPEWALILFRVLGSTNY